MASARARSYWVLSCRPTQSETALSFAALGDLLAEVPHEVMSSLPTSQHRGLQVALHALHPLVDCRSIHAPQMLRVVRALAQPQVQRWLAVAAGGEIHLRHRHAQFTVVVDLAVADE